MPISDVHKRDAGNRCHGCTGPERTPETRTIPSCRDLISPFFDSQQTQLWFIATITTVSVFLSTKIWQAYSLGDVAVKDHSTDHFETSTSLISETIRLIIGMCALFAPIKLTVLVCWLGFYFKDLPPLFPSTLGDPAFWADPRFTGALHTGVFVSWAFRALTSCLQSELLPSFWRCTSWLREWEKKICEKDLDHYW